MIAAIRARFLASDLTKGVALQTLFLFGVDSLTNVVDYGFHVYLGRALVPGDFAVFQTINSALIVVITAFGVFQPVVARFVAEAEDGKGNGAGELGRRGEEERGGRGEGHTIFRAYFWWSSLAGLGLGGLVLVGRHVLAGWLNVPPLAIALSAGVVLLAFSRPVVWGMLQGQERFIWFGLTRLIFAVSRFAVAAGLIMLGWAAIGAVAALPVGMVLSWGLGVMVLWRVLTPPQSSPHTGKKWREGIKLAGYAFLAYAAHTALLNLDMVWVNRTFTPNEAGGYAGAVLLRRILLLLPGVIVVVFYPRVVTTIARGVLPDRLLLISMGAVGGTVLALTAGYFVAGDWIVQAVFGEGFALAGPLLGWMGVGILGYSLGTIWMNLALATRPGKFVGLLVGALGLQTLGLAFWADTLPRVVAVFVMTGWWVALGGLLLYIWLRPQLVFTKKEAN